MEDRIKILKQKITKHSELSYTEKTVGDFSQPVSVIILQLSSRAFFIAFSATVVCTVVSCRPKTIASRLSADIGAGKCRTNVSLSHVCRTTYSKCTIKHLRVQLTAVQSWQPLEARTEIQASQRRHFVR